jgi:hypothetical protein
VAVVAVVASFLEIVSNEAGLVLRNIFPPGDIRRNRGDEKYEEVLFENQRKEDRY